MSEAEQTKIEQTLSQRNITQRVRSPRISDLPASDHDDGLVATFRAAQPRPPFRSPSSVQVLQMASPPASTLGPPHTPDHRLAPGLALGPVLAPEDAAALQARHAAPGPAPRHPAAPALGLGPRPGPRPPRPPEPGRQHAA